MNLPNKRLFLFDIDGTLALGDELFSGTRELLDAIDQKGGVSVFITNNSTRSGADYVKRFADVFRLETREDQFITSGALTLDFLKGHFSGKKIYCLGTASYIAELRRNGLRITEKCEDDLDCILVAYDSEVNYGKLCEASKALQTTDAPFYATNPDLRCPAPFGFIPDCGSICEMLTETTGKVPTYLGKPAAEMVRVAQRSFGFGDAETVVVGDRLYTDIACGINAGVDTILLLTGEARREDLADTKFPPSLVLEDVEALVQAYGAGSDV